MAKLTMIRFCVPFLVFSACTVDLSKDSDSDSKSNPEAAEAQDGEADAGAKQPSSSAGTNSGEASNTASDEIIAVEQDKQAVIEIADSIPSNPGQDLQSKEKAEESMERVSRLEEKLIGQFGEYAVLEAKLEFCESMVALAAALQSDLNSGLIDQATVDDLTSKIESIETCKEI
ncbi:hypothetical protein [Pseudobacteriovorax antillogorgiicola]|uniref:Uncharacterized protein n=1 Tax=Pseudobacteriovorax antillogorgiicola TaxID=1513793 RepID=A0A1Y6BJ51_9BACT|nr:hypothetical protein [Pseudobacteriovorax antillogorgiicola]TCS55447.1 hypothetical protein EDD56_105168 [Pseudobacteriovorax antillogorgiicola]SMF12353.1 hypothetical protein SAMN06296036_105156 [Pseudobacteriovorax antillogorgiicola]